MAAGVLEKPMSADVNLEDVGAADADIKAKPKKIKEKDGLTGGAYKKKGGAGRIVVLLLILIFVGALVGVIGFNAFGVRDRYLLTTLERIPLINGLLPEAAHNGAAGEEPLVSAEELQAQIDVLNRRLEQSLRTERDEVRKNEMYVDEILRLTEFEEAQLQYRADKEEFDRMIAMGDPAAYARFYAQIAPENAEVLGPEAEVAVRAAKEFQTYIKTIGAMEEKEIALMLTEMIRSDLDRVVLIISSLPNDVAGAVLGAMEPKDAASVVKRWSPEAP